jgi:hypothetical protein
MISENEKFLREVEAFLLKTEMGQTRFGVESCGNRSLVARLRSGSSVTLPTVDRVRAYMRNYNAKKKPSLRVERVSA